MSVLITARAPPLPTGAAVKGRTDAGGDLFGEFLAHAQPACRDKASSHTGFSGEGSISARERGGI